MSAKKIEKLLVFMGFCFASVLVSAFVLTCIGLVDLRTVYEFVMPPAWEYAALALMFHLNLYFVLKIILGGGSVFRLVFWYAPVYWATTLIDLGFISTTLLPILYGLACGSRLKWKKPKEILANTAVLLVVVGIEQALSLVIRSGWEQPALPARLNAATTAVYSIDLLITYIFLVLGVKRNVVVAKIPVRFLSILSERESVPGLSENLEAEIGELSQSTEGSRLVFRLAIFGYWALQLLLVLGIGMLNNVLAELCVMLVVFFVGRAIFGASWHSDSLWICMGSTLAVFYVLTKVTLPFGMSLFTVVVLSCLLVYGLHLLADVSTWHGFYLAHTEFNLNTCDKEILIERCRLCGMTQEDSDLCIALFFEKRPVKELASAHNMEEQSMRNKKRRLAKRLMQL